MKLIFFLSTLLWIFPLTLYANHPPSQEDPVGLSLFFQNGATQPLTLLKNTPRYLQELDIVSTIETSTDQGIQPIIDTGDLSDLNWTGIEFVEEDWRPDGNGTFTRQRFYRNARWMERPSLFLAFPLDDNGYVVGPPIRAFAGKDNKLTPANDAFVRRFVARQTTFGCVAIGDCSNASSFVAEGLVQLRYALKAENRSRLIPEDATSLFLFWTEDVAGSRSVFISHEDRSNFDFGYGLDVSLEEISLPNNGSFYLPGETVDFQITYRDNDGNRLHPSGSLPTYGEFFRGEVESGIRYFDLFINPTLYYALKHREGNSLATISGPTDRIVLPSTPVDIFEFFLGQVNVATTAEDGYTSLALGIPPIAIIFGGLTDPTIWDLPVSDIVSFSIPLDALPGTYVAATKARRDFGGEALNRATTTEFQVGSATETQYISQTGPCTTCHSGPSDIGEILHGLADRRVCFACHTALSTEPDNFLDIRIHTIHDRSDRYPADIQDCSTCHLTPPTGPARGILGN